MRVTVTSTDPTDGIRHMTRPFPAGSEYECVGEVRTDTMTGALIQSPRGFYLSTGCLTVRLPFRETMWAFSGAEYRVHLDLINRLRMEQASNA